MKNFRSISVMLLAAVTLLGACAEDELLNEQEPAYPEQTVLFTTQEAVTRGTPVNDYADLTDMGIYYVHTGASDWQSTTNYPASSKKYRKMNKTAGSNKWTYADAPVYWEAGRQSFFAYTPYETGIGGNGITTTENGITGTPTVYYQTPTDVTRQPDLMVAVPRYNLTPTLSRVQLEMKHALTCVGFQVKGNGEKIKGISIEGVAVSGRMAMDGSNIKWTTKATPTLINSVAINCDPGKNHYTCTPDISTNLIAGNGYLMMIPQTLNPVTARVVITLSDGRTKKIDLSTQTWEPGKRVTYTIDMGNMTISTKKTYGWGQYDNTAGYIMQPNTAIKSGTRQIVDAPINFGEDANSAVKIERYSSASTFDHSLLTNADAYNPAKVKAMFDTKPDIVLSGFDIDVTAAKRAEVAGYMLDYLKDGGTLVLALENPGLLKAFIEALYPNATIDIIWKTTNMFRIADVGDEITNGPFGNIGGGYWGNDSKGTRSISGIPENDLVVYSRDEDGNPTMFRHKVYNLMFIGDGGAFANYNGKPGADGGTPAAVTHPLAFDTDGRPITCTKWTGNDSSLNNDVENGRLFANIMAWAVRQAEINGINKK